MTNKNIGSFEVKIQIHPMLETPVLSVKNHKIKKYKRVRQIII